MRPATLIYFADAPRCERWGIGYDHEHLVVRFRFRERHHAHEYAVIWCRNHAVPYVP